MSDHSAPPQACEGMARSLADSRVPIRYVPKFREYGLEVTGSSAIQGIEYCPWCGVELPASLRDEYFDRLEAMGLEPGDAESITAATRGGECVV